MNEPEAVLRQYGVTDPVKVRNMGPTGQERILDVGCGPGGFLSYLRRHGHQGRLVGLDQSPAMIAEAQTVARGAKGVAWRHLARPQGRRTLCRRGDGA